MNESRPTATFASRALTQDLAARGWSREEIAGFLVGQSIHGALRPNCPTWLRRTVLFLARHSQGSPRLQIDAALATVDAALAEPAPGPTYDPAADPR